MYDVKCKGFCFETIIETYTTSLYMGGIFPIFARTVQNLCISKRPFNFQVLRNTMGGQISRKKRYEGVWRYKRVKFPEKKSYITLEWH